MLQGTDEGLLIVGAVRVLNGQVFARDFFEQMGPAAFWWPAVFLKMFGETFFATRICLFLTSLGTALLIYALSRKVCARFSYLPCVLVLGTYFATLWPEISHHVDSNFFGLLAVGCIVQWQDRHKVYLLPIAGALAAITTCILQPKGILLLLAILMWLGVQRWKNLTSSSSLVLVMSGYASIIGLVILYFGRQGALSDLFNATFIYNFQRYASANSVPYGRWLFESYWARLTTAIGLPFWTIIPLIILSVPSVLIAAIPALLALLGVIYRKKLANPTVLLYGLCGMAFWLSEIHRPDISHLVMGSPILIILLVSLITTSRAEWAIGALKLVAFCGGFLTAANFCLVLIPHTTATRAGPIVMFAPDPTLAYIEAHIPPGQSIFVYPYNPMYYFLTKTNNPVRYSGLFYNYNTTAQFQDAIQDLDRHKVSYVVWDTNYVPKIMPKLFPSAKRMPPSQYLMEPYLESHYEAVWNNNGIVLMKRNPDSLP
jgi:hypothetical protein